jgi:hypothetical protein
MGNGGHRRQPPILGNLQNARNSSDKIEMSGFINPANVDLVV